MARSWLRSDQENLKAPGLQSPCNKTKGTSGSLMAGLDSTLLESKTEAASNQVVGITALPHSLRRAGHLPPFFLTTSLLYYFHRQTSLGEIRSPEIPSTIARKWRPSTPSFRTSTTGTFDTLAIGFTTLPWSSRVSKIYPQRSIALSLHTLTSKISLCADLCRTHGIERG